MTATDELIDAAHFDGAQDLSPLAESDSTALLVLAMILFMLGHGQSVHLQRVLRNPNTFWS